MKPIRFTATVVPGSHRGRLIGFPTINVDLAEVPQGIPPGIYACRITIGGTTYPGAMHIGPRPVFRDTPSCEVHVIDAVPENVPDRVEIKVIEFVREVRDFPDAAALTEQLRRDVDLIRAMLQNP